MCWAVSILVAVLGGAHGALPFVCTYQQFIQLLFAENTPEKTESLHPFFYQC
jgi:hypothetical protein